MKEAHSLFCIFNTFQSKGFLSYGSSSGGTNVWE